MKQKLLLFLFMGSLAVSADAQRKNQKTTAYAITAAQKGNSAWTEVRLVDVHTGEVLKTVHENKVEVPTLNARTKKPIAKKDVANNELHTSRTATNGQTFEVVRTKDNVVTYIIDKAGNNLQTATKVAPNGQVVEVIRSRDNAVAYTIDKAGTLASEEVKKASTELRRLRKDVTVTNVELKDLKITSDVHTNVNVNTNNNVHTTHRIIVRRSAELLDKPFSTNSAACAYDKKHERLYYTPMGINELRYIDLKAKAPSVYYFENEAFGALTSRHDVPNQITRMVIAGDGQGYALTNNGKHLIKFTTDKKATITDLGELTDDPANGRYSVRSSGGYGGDMVADEKNSLYLIQANRAVFKIGLDTKVASYIGHIKGLPAGFSTNGAAVEQGTSIIVSSANSTLGYYRFDLETLVAEKISQEGTVYNASDLANGNLISVKKKKAEKDPEPILEEKLVSAPAETERNGGAESLVSNKISVYPNPVAMGGVVKVAFKDQPSGIYTLQFMDIAGKLISSKQVNVSSRQHIEEFALPELTARGNYLLKAVSDSKKVVSVNKVIVQ